MADYKEARSMCECGHTGDGPCSQHASLVTEKDGMVVEDGHGGCKVCNCDRFTWDDFLPGYAEWLNQHRCRKR
jgi:hypothetical protein